MIIAAVCSDTPLVRLTRDERREVVSWLAGQGMSTRAIAPVVGADHVTVSPDLSARDADASPASPATPDDPTFNPIHSWDVVNSETHEVLPGNDETPLHLQLCPARVRLATSQQLRST